MADMEDIAEMLQSFLSSGSSDAPQHEHTANDTVGQEESFSGIPDADTGGNPFAGFDGMENMFNMFEGIDFDMLMKFGSMFSKMQEHDKNTDLLYALRAHLRVENQAKIDTAIRIVRMMAIMPYLKDTGLMGNLF